jgi:hypothetical protein
LEEILDGGGKPGSHSDDRWDDLQKKQTSGIGEVILDILSILIPWRLERAIKSLIMIKRQLSANFQWWRQQKQLRKK